MNRKTAPAPMTAIAHTDTQIHRRVDSGAWFPSDSRNEVSKTCIVPLYIGYRYTVKRYIPGRGGQGPSRSRVTGTDILVTS
jgi:hypothetical protein